MWRTKGKEDGVNSYIVDLPCKVVVPVITKGWKSNKLTNNTDVAIFTMYNLDPNLDDQRMKTNSRTTYILASTIPHRKYFISTLILLNIKI